MEKLNSCQIPCRSYKKSAFKNIQISSSCKAIHQETQPVSSRRKTSRLEEAFQFQCCLFELTFASLRENLIFEVLATKI